MPTNLDTPERRAAHAGETLARLKKGYIITGVRLVDADNVENGHVVTFDEREGKADGRRGEGNHRGARRKKSRKAVMIFDGDAQH
jgi:hypothetical protein